MSIEERHKLTGDTFKELASDEQLELLLKSNCQTKMLLRKTPESSGALKPQ